MRLATRARRTRRVRGRARALRARAAGRAPPSWMSRSRTSSALHDRGGGVACGDRFVRRAERLREQLGNTLGISFEEPPPDSRPDRPSPGGERDTKRGDGGLRGVDAVGVGGERDGASRRSSGALSRQRLRSIHAAGAMRAQRFISPASGSGRDSDAPLPLEVGHACRDDAVVGREHRRARALDARLAHRAPPRARFGQSLRAGQAGLPLLGRSARGGDATDEARSSTSSSQESRIGPLPAASIGAMACYEGAR